MISDESRLDFELIGDEVHISIVDENVAVQFALDYEEVVELLEQVKKRMESMNGEEEE